MRLQYSKIVIVDEWTSVSNKRYLNVILKSDLDTHNLGLVRCKGSVTSKVQLYRQEVYYKEFISPERLK